MIRVFARLRTLRRRLVREEGFALVLALGMTTVFGIVSATTVAYTTSNQKSATYSKIDQTALALAEAGLNNALSNLYAAPNPSMESALPTESAPASKAYDGGTALWYGKLSNDVWTLTGVGRVPNPNAPNRGDVVRVVSSRVKLGSSTRGSSNNAVWNYVYADELSGCTTIRNSSEVNVPLYVRGNLCLENSATVTGYALQVGGTLSVTGSQASVGTPTAHVTEVHVGVGCKAAGGVIHDPCTTADKVYADKVTSEPTGLTKPPLELERFYNESKPGPMHPCTVGSMPGGFDTDTTLNRSRRAFDLTPSTPYDCRVYDANGVLEGQISWTPGAPGTLVIAGTVFFDGDITMGQYSQAVYQGRATIYASGKITIGQQSSRCWIANCTAEWKATEHLFAFVVGSSTDATSF